MMPAGDDVIVAPGVCERLSQWCAADGPEARLAIALQGVPVYVSGLMPNGSWQRWENGRLVDAGTVEEPA